MHHIVYIPCARFKFIKVNFISFQLNASDDRGIGIVRGTILSFASTRTIFKYEVRALIHIIRQGSGPKNHGPFWQDFRNLRL